MAGTATPADSTAPSAEYEDEDFDVVNAEQIEGVEDDEETADDADPQDVAYEDETDVRSNRECVRACSSCCVNARRSCSGSVTYHIQCLYRKLRRPQP